VCSHRAGKPIVNDQLPMSKARAKNSAAAKLWQFIGAIPEIDIV
jgi:hypothetical protein